MHTKEIDVGCRYGIGPIGPMYDHSTMTAFNRPGRRPQTVDPVLFACLDCGYVASDVRLFMHEECNEHENPINQTWRQFIEEEGFPEP